MVGILILRLASVISSMLLCIDVNRFQAWEICEDHGMSELVTFQSAKQRDNLYEILRNNYNDTVYHHFWEATVHTTT